MGNINKFMQEEFLPFYKRVYEAYKQNHHALYSMIKTFMSGKRTKIGIQIMDNGNVLGEYTLNLDGPEISHIEENVLNSEVYTPFGVIKPYTIIEKSTLEKMIKDEPSFIREPIATKMKYLRDATIKFL